MCLWRSVGREKGRKSAMKSPQEESKSTLLFRNYEGVLGKVVGVSGFFFNRSPSYVILSFCVLQTHFIHWHFNSYCQFSFLLEYKLFKAKFREASHMRNESELSFRLFYHSPWEYFAYTSLGLVTPEKSCRLKASFKIQRERSITVPSVF